MGGMERKRKKVYESPQVTKVSLRPEEAVLGACKIAGSAGAVGHSCNANQCLSQGS
jgi:hypothetical protein